MHDGTPVRVTVTGTDTSREKVTLSTRGYLHEASDGWTLHYEETSPEDMSVIHTLVQVQCDDPRVTVTRTGTLLSTLVFDEHDTFVGDYPTPVGNFQIRVYASEVNVRRRGAIGHIHLVYQVSLSTALSPNEDTSTRWLDIRFIPCR